MTLKIYSCVRKGLKLKVLQETSGKSFCTPPPPILNRAKGKLTDSRSVKTIKKEKYRFHWFIDYIVEVICIVTVIILENMFGNIKSAVLTSGEIGEGECAVELACLEMLNISLHNTVKVRTILVLTCKNQLIN